MTKIVVLGAGIGGVPMAFELKELLGKKAEITVVSQTDYFQFVPSNPWVAVNWRKPSDVKVSLPDVFKKLKIDFTSVGAKRVKPERKRGRAERRFDAVIRLSRHRDRSASRLRRSRRTWGRTAIRNPSVTSITPGIAGERWEEFCKNPGPMVVGAVQGASCFGPAYEYALTAVADLRKRKIRDRVPITFVTSEPYIGHLGLGGVGDTKGMLESVHARPRHQMGHKRENRQHQRRFRRGDGVQRRRIAKEDA